jgi:flagellar assembly protein FliH
MSMLKTIVKKGQSADVVFDFKAKDFPLRPSAVASEFISGQAKSTSDFQINPLAAEQAGIAKLQRDAMNDRVEEEALKQLKSVEEKAYKEAFELGLVEGREQAFQEKKQLLHEKIQHMDEIMAMLEGLKTKVVADHEAHIIRLIFEIASRIAMREIKQDPTSILPVILQVVQDAQSEEQITVRLSQDDFLFLEKMREKTGKTAEALRRVRLEAAEGVRSGGCLLESNYGSIDATVETRVSRAWEALEARAPHVDQRTTKKGDGNNGSPS